MGRGFWATKPITEVVAESTDAKHGLRKALSAWNLVALGIGGIIGAGIFVLTGHAAASYAGPGIVFSFIFSSIACAFAGLCYAEFAAMIPIAGSAYTYTYVTLGEFFAWVIGWNLILEYLFGAATVAVGWSSYVTSFLKDLHIVMPEALSNAPFAFDSKLGWHATGALCNFPAMLIILLVSLLLIVGIRESAKFNNIIVILKLIVIGLFILCGVSYINLENWVPFVPPNTGNFGEFGISGILRGAGVIFFAYIGFDAVSTAAQEAKNPQRDMPIGILGSLAVCTVLYITVALVLTGVVKYTSLNVPDPMAVGVNALGNSFFWLRPIIKIGAIAGLSSVILVLVLGQTRIFYSMAHDGLLPLAFGKVHRKYRTPHITTYIVGALAMALAGLFPIGILGEMVSIGTLMAFAIVCISILVLRYKRPNIPRPFKTPAVWFVCIMGALLALAQMLGLPSDTWWRLLIWTAIGFIIYWFYGCKKRPHAPN
ncbi:MAG: amino acid permease [Pseudomonadota bacterium]